MRTGVLIHGCHLHVPEWKHIAWGSPDSGMGRFPAGLLYAVESAASVIIMGTGASFRTYSDPESMRFGETLSEAEYSFEFLRMNIDKLRDFPDWHATADKLPSCRDWCNFKQQLLARIHLDKTSTNTVSELANAAETFVEADVDQMMIVTSPSHLVRATRDALSLLNREPVFSRLRSRFMAVASTTDFRHSCPADVLVLEPPHRPDRAGADCRAQVSRLLKLRSACPRSYAALLEDLNQLLLQYEEEVEPVSL